MSDFTYSKFIDVNKESGQVFFDDVIDDDGYWFYIPERLLLVDKEDV